MCVCVCVCENVCVSECVCVCLYIISKSFHYTVYVCTLSVYNCIFL